MPRFGKRLSTQNQVFGADPDLLCWWCELGGRNHLSISRKVKSLNVLACSLERSRPNQWLSHAIALTRGVSVLEEAAHVEYDGLRARVPMRWHGC